MMTQQVIVFIIGTVIIIFGAYYVTYYIGTKASGQSRGKLRNRNIYLIDRFAISRDKGFYLMEIAGKVYVIGVTNQSMTLLDTLDAAAFAEIAAQRPEPTPWPVMPGGKYTGRITKRLAVFIAKKMGRDLEIDESGDSETFADSMDKAREKNRSGQPECAESERTDDPENPGGYK